MFLDAFGNPKEVTADNLNSYSYDLHGTKLLTSAEVEFFMPPNWHGTIYSSDELLYSYRKRFNPDPTLLSFHSLQPYEPEFICCKNAVVELTLLPAGQSLYSDKDIVVFLVKQPADGRNVLITKELGSELNFFPHNHHYHARIMDEGIDVVYVDDKIYNGNGPLGYQHQRLYNVLRNIQPGAVLSLSGRPLPDVLRSVCRKPAKEHN
ncbi:uncharacterized protein LOC128261582 [Drosophila gunungcola]|uniref:Uncharacterized protein n=1 Tax=Drosophila gunungcola TaxID=103775 RepID=A0A9P9YSW0_9MUSC|nr:uncharacterized protein LOC128261582 [Drosophila gunungcola]KAI8042549.1 hypothetical protein M5D96_003862 [Drosophila gunungcola]